MTGKGRQADSELVGRTLCDIAQVLESAHGAGGRLLGALELLGKIVPYQQCALLDAEAGSDPRLLALPALPPDEKGGLTSALIGLFGKMLEERALAPEPSLPPWQGQLAVPLVGLGEVIGVLFVRRDEGTYQKQELRVLSLVAAQLAAYLTMLRARAEVSGRGRELENTQQTAQSALRAQDALVKLFAHEMRTPLATAVAWVRLLGSRDLAPDERARAVAAIGRSIRTQARLVDELLDRSSIPGEELRLDLRTLEAAGLAEAAPEGLPPLEEHRPTGLQPGEVEEDAQQ
jgi:signal transduction histidine kinase